MYSYLGIRICRFYNAQLAHKQKGEHPFEGPQTMVDVEVSDLIERFANGVMISQSDQLAVIKVTGYTTGELCHIDGAVMASHV